MEILGQRTTHPLPLGLWQQLPAHTGGDRGGHVSTFALVIFNVVTQPGGWGTMMTHSDRWKAVSVAHV